MKNGGFCYYNGVITEFNSASVPLSDRSIFFAEAVYDVAIGENRVIYQLSEHLDRLIQNAEFLCIPHPTKDELTMLSYMLVNRLDDSPFTLYIQLSGYGELRDHSQCSEDKFNLLITVTQRTQQDEGSISVTVEDDKRHAICNIKSTNLLCAVLSARRAKKSGFSETVYLRDGVVTECSHSNILIVSSGKVYTHPDCRHLLPGITKSNIRRICKQKNIPFIDCPFSIDKMMMADAVIICSTTKFARRVSSIDGVRINSSENRVFNEISKALNDEYCHKINESRCKH